MNILNYKDEISLVANVVTIFAFILAIIAFLNWKKELKDSKKLDYIMGLEDSFEALMYSIKIEFKFFSDMDKNLINIEKESKEYKKQLDNFIKDEFSKYSNSKTIEIDFHEYSISLVRAKRFLNDIDSKCKVLDYYFLKELSLKAIKVTPKWKDKDTISNESEDFLKELIEIHKEGLKYLEKLYK